MPHRLNERDAGLYFSAADAYSTHTWIPYFRHPQSNDLTKDQPPTSAGKGEEWLANCPSVQQGGEHKEASTNGGVGGGEMHEALLLRGGEELLRSGEEGRGSPAASKLEATQENLESPLNM